MKTVMTSVNVCSRITTQLLASMVIDLTYRDEISLKSFFRTTGGPSISFCVGTSGRQYWRIRGETESQFLRVIFRLVQT